MALEEGEVIRVALEAEAMEGTGVVSEDVVAEGVVDPLHQGKILNFKISLDIASGCGPSI